MRVGVTQADREAAERIWHLCDDGPYCDLPKWLVQAFARHRIAALDAVEKHCNAAQYSPHPYTDLKYAIRALKGDTDV